MLTELTALPNIGKAIATDLLAIGIGSHDDFKGKDALKIFDDLKAVMGHRHDVTVRGALHQDGGIAALVEIHRKRQGGFGI